MMNKRFLPVLALAVLPGALSAQEIEFDNTRYGGTAAQFLTLPGDARGAALGGSYAALVSDATSMFWNPAGIALMEGANALFTYTPYVADTRHIWAGVATTLRGGEWGIGLSVSNFGFGDQPVYTFEDPDGEGGETYDVSETAVGLTVGLQFSDRFSAGMTGRFVQEQLARTTATGFTVDFGTNYHAELGGRPFRASFAVLNFGTPFRASGPVLNTVVDAPEGGMGVEPTPAQIRTNAFDPPTQFHVGVAYDVMAGARNRLTLLSEFWQPNDSDPGVSFAGEFAANVGENLTAALRGSYAYQADNDGVDASSTFNERAFASDGGDDAALDGLSLGGGLRWNSSETFSVGLDYAFRHLGVLSTVNMFSISVAW